MSNRREYARRCHSAIREVLLHEWDPIGVAGIPQAADEYDDYIGQIYGLLIRQEPLFKLVDYLWWAETEHMGLAGNRRRTEQIAERLKGLGSDLEQDNQRE